jgi:hypothetical protein
MKRIIDKLQVLALRRPLALQLLDHVLDGLLSENRSDADHERDPS